MCACTDYSLDIIYDHDHCADSGIIEKQFAHFLQFKVHTLFTSLPMLLFITLNQHHHQHHRRLRTYHHIHMNVVMVRQQQHNNIKLEKRRFVLGTHVYHFKAHTHTRPLDWPEIECKLFWNNKIRQQIPTSGKMSFSFNVLHTRIDWNSSQKRKKKQEHIQRKSLFQVYKPPSHLIDGRGNGCPTTTS